MRNQKHSLSLIKMGTQRGKNLMAPATCVTRRALFEQNVTTGTTRFATTVPHLAVRRTLASALPCSGSARGVLVCGRGASRYCQAPRSEAEWVSRFYHTRRTNPASQLYTLADPSSLSESAKEPPQIPGIKALAGEIAVNGYPD
jgi:hypothetical protein